MDLLASQLRFEWLSLRHWVGSGFSVAFLLLAPPVFATSDSPQTLLIQPELDFDVAESLPKAESLSKDDLLSESKDQQLVPQLSKEDSAVSEASDTAEQESESFNQDPGSTEFEALPASETNALPSPNPDYTVPISPPQQQPVPLPNSNFYNQILGIPQTPDFDTYRLGPGDSIFVNVRQFPDLSFQATLDLQGNVITPLQGVTPLSGLTLQEAENLIGQIYNQYVVEPDVGITLVAQRGVEVTILGEVVRPGFYPLGAPQISAALLVAGGTTGEADLRSVMVQRRLPDGQLLERNVDLFTPLKDGQELPDVALQDGDVIIVERLDPSALDEYDRELVSRSTIAQPTITIRLLNHGANRGGRGGAATGGTLTAIELPNGSRFIDALVRANLNTDTSKLRDVALIRFDEEAGQAVATTLNGNEAFRGIPSENPPLQDNDVIIIDRTLVARITYALSTFTQPFRDVLGFLLFFDSLADSADSLFSP
ncbi:MAG: polysaccharide export protein [Leptolyngbya sp. SIO1D8]|nr:polysaccharide export protein [Leptolyngbya sp. SIO1D8]